MNVLSRLAILTEGSARFSLNQPNRKRWGARLGRCKTSGQISTPSHKAFLYLWHHHFLKGVSTYLGDNGNALKVGSTTLGPITMYQQQSLSFHVVSQKKLLHKITLFSIPGTFRFSFCLSLATSPVLHVLHALLHPEIRKTLLAKPNPVAN